MSQKAFKYKKDNPNIVEYGGQNGMLHLEHITPKGYVYTKLTELTPPTREAIAACFKHCKLVLLTKEESDTYLDGKNTKFKMKDVRTLQKVFQIDDNSLQEAKTLVDNEKSPKSHGFGLLRLVHLYKSGVRFCNSKGKRRGLKQCLTYLEQDNYEIKSDTRPNP